MSIAQNKTSSLDIYLVLFGVKEHQGFNPVMFTRLSHQQINCATDLDACTRTSEQSIKNFSKNRHVNMWAILQSTYYITHITFKIHLNLSCSAFLTLE